MVTADRCRLLTRIDPAGARLDDYARLLRAISRAFPDAHHHPSEGLAVVYVGRHPDPAAERYGAQ